MKRLFGDTKEESWLEEADALDKEVTDALRPIIKKQVELGHSMRDVKYIIDCSSMDLTLMEILS